MTFFIEIKITNFKNLTIKLYVFEILNTHVKILCQLDIVGAQRTTIRPNLYLGSQPICFVGF